MMKQEHARYRVREGNKILLETNDLAIAREAQKNAHRKNPTKYHEIYRWHDGDVAVRTGYLGVYQLKPYDCPECEKIPKNCKCKQKQVMNIFQLELSIMESADRHGRMYAEASTTWHLFWYWISWSLPFVFCPECGSYNRYQDPEALENGYSVLVCRNCGCREFDD